MAWSAILVCAAAAPLGPADEAYLWDLASDTWRCIAAMAAPETGLPYDNDDKSEFTSTSNVGVYLSCVAAAHKLGLIDAKEADRRVDQTLTSVEKLQTWHGFHQCWNSVKTLKPAQHDPWISLLDTGNCVAGLMAVGVARPAFRRRCDQLVGAMEWSWFWDQDQKALIGGYDTLKGAFNKGWHVDALGTDAAMAAFLAIANGAAPPSFWGTLNRQTETRNGQTYLWPGWQGGGLFMQYINGLWLDLSKTEVGPSQIAFARAQMAHAKERKLPAWGWSACDDPNGGYLGWGALKDDVVAPHACVLAIEHFPKEVVANLRALEALGARSKDQGFYDSIALSTKKPSSKFLVLDQGMLLLSLTNDLEGGAVRKWFGAHPIAKRGRVLIWGE